jgi:hypothetical protein
MNAFRKAAKLSEVATVVDLQPLQSGDGRYVDISAGRGGSNDLKLLRLRLMQFDAREDRFAKFAFTGHRGCGKSTELLRLEHEVSDRFTPLHLYADEALLGDYDYTDLFLWLVDELVRKFEADRTPLDPRLADQVALWFAEVSLKQTDQVKSEIALETEAKAAGKASLFWLSLGLLARLKSMVVGSTERRKEIRRELQNKSSELISHVNLLLDHAHEVLAGHGKPANLLIVVDNLDRLDPKVSFPLFFRNGDLLKQLKAHVIYTVPVASDLAPMNIGRIFEDKFTLSMVKVRNDRGKLNKPGIDALEEAVSHRVEIDAVFEARKEVRKLAEMSGGNVRDLMRLIQGAQLVALADDKERIDAAAVKRAVLRMRLDYERVLIPGRVYYAFLARVHLTTSAQYDGDNEADPEKVQKYRDFFNHLLFNGSILEYNGDRMWYDVHPVIQEIEAFKEALKKAEADAESASQSEGPA